MREFYPYYEQEIGFMREMAAEFARNFPEVASRLDLERHRSDDPHVERLIEAFCLIAARVHYRLDADFPEITKAFLNIVFPHYLRPVPSMTIAEFRVKDDSLDQSDAIAIDPGEPLSIGDDVCEFRTCYPVQVWPIRIKDAALLDAGALPEWARVPKASGAIHLTLQCAATFAKLKELNRLRFSSREVATLPTACMN